MTTVDPQLQFTVEQLLARYVHALDDDRLEDWPGFFSVSGRYRITTAENHAQGLPLCIVQADSQAMMRDRVAALLGGEASRVSDEDLTRIEDLVKNARIEELARNARSERR